MGSWLLFCTAVAVAASTAGAADMAHERRVVGMNAMRRRDMVLVHRANATTLAAAHEVLVAVTQLNLDVLEREVAERSDPANAFKYQEWLSFDEVGAIVRNVGATRTVTAWLEENGATVTWTAPFGDYVRAVAPLRTWEHLLSAEFHVWEEEEAARLPSAAANTAAEARRVRHHVRSESYTIPAHLSSSLSAVFNVADFPARVTPRAYRRSVEGLGKEARARGEEGEQEKAPPPSREATPPPPPPGLAGRLRVALQGTYPGTTVGFLNAFYHIQSNLGSADVTQAVYETNDEYFSQGPCARVCVCVRVCWVRAWPSRTEVTDTVPFSPAGDLLKFQKKYGLTVQPAVDVSGGRWTTTSCGSAGIDCSEGQAVKTSSVVALAGGVSPPPLCSSCLFCV